MLRISLSSRDFATSSSFSTGFAVFAGSEADSRSGGGGTGVIAESALVRGLSEDSRGSDFDFLFDSDLGSVCESSEFALEVTVRYINCRIKTNKSTFETLRRLQKTVEILEVGEILLRRVCRFVVVGRLFFF